MVAETEIEVAPEVEVEVAEIDIAEVLVNADVVIDDIEVAVNVEEVVQIDDVVEEITDVYGLEVNLFLENLYAGTADCVGTINGIESIIDFKTARRIKKKEWIDDYFLQGCAYANAHNVMFNTKISQVVILMVDRDLI